MQTGGTRMRIPNLSAALQFIQGQPTSRRSMAPESIAVCLLLFIQAVLLGYSATRHSPTDLEPAFLASGLSHWKFGQFEAYRVNPPLVRMVAAIPVIAVGYKMEWPPLQETPGSRPEFGMGQRFLHSNGADSIPLFFYARWICIPFNLIGAYFAYRWAKELYGGCAGLVTLTLYVFEPNLLAHGELITPDGAATAFGIMAGYAFWRWLKQPTWTRAGLAGLALGLAELSKTSWLILFGLWPILWVVWRWLEPHRAGESGLTAVDINHPVQSVVDKADTVEMPPPLLQLMAIPLLGVYLINLAYAFDGIGTPLKEFQFVSKSLTGLDKSGSPGNRFKETWLGNIPVPLPKQYVLGIDSQKKDFEGHHLTSYLRGELKKQGGWWYYYLYGLLIKVPCGTWGLLALVILTRAIRRNGPATLRDELVLLVPAMTLLILVSSQTAFNLHLRYVFPALGLGLVFLGQVASKLTRTRSAAGLIALGLIAESVISLAMVYPHHLAYFNAFVGGPQYGHRHLLGSSLDWGQDLLFLRDHAVATGDVVQEIRGSYINLKLVRSTIPNYASDSAIGLRIVVVSPNCLLKDVPFSPSGQMLTPTLWIAEETEVRP